jgi:glycosyltransferase involved in cell wall biosynthesis
VESFATGTPVIAYARGSMKELIRDGVTGYLVDGIDAAVHAVKALERIDRGACRMDAQVRFTSTRMVDEYERLFQSVVDAR